MAITTNASYIPTINEFLAHWAQVNAAIEASMDIGVEGRNTAVDRAAFVGIRDAVQEAQDGVIDKLNDVEIARADIELRKGALLGWLNQFNGVIEGYYGGTKFATAKPLAPGIGDGEGKFLDPMVDVKSLWAKINDAPAQPGLNLPLALADGTTQALFAAAIADLRTAYETAQNVELELTLARDGRDLEQALAYAVMKNYRIVVPVRAVLFPAVANSAPRLTPEPGHAVAPVNASAVFVAPDQAHVVHAASADPALEKYELRGNPGADYREADAVVLGSHLPGTPDVFDTGLGLNQPGGKVALKVFVIVDTGNEAGSAGMVVVRPA